VVPDRKAVGRKTDDRVYTVAGPDYHPMQNADAFKFFDEVVKTGMVGYETAGSLQNGARTWILAKMKSPLEVAGAQVDRDLTLVNSHDGTAALQMFWTPIRVVCMNTLRFAQSRKIGETFYARHTKGISDRADHAKLILGLADSYYADWLKQAEYLTAKKLTDEQAAKIVAVAFGQDGNEKVYAPVQKAMDKVLELRFTGVGQDNTRVQGSAWQLFNAVVEYADYYKAPRSKVESARLSSVWFGSGATLKEKAWTAVMKA